MVTHRLEGSGEWPIVHQTHRASTEVNTKVRLRYKSTDDPLRLPTASHSNFECFLEIRPLRRLPPLRQERDFQMGSIRITDGSAGLTLGAVRQTLDLRRKLRRDSRRRGTRGDADGRARGRPHPRPRLTQHRAARHSRAPLRVTRSRLRPSVGRSFLRFCWASPGDRSWDRSGGSPRTVCL